MSTLSFEARVELGMIPKEALVLGMTDEDNEPVLLNLRDPVPGPLLVIADSGAGKTALLKGIAQVATKTHGPDKLKVGVITNRPHEWQTLSELPQCAGIFAVNDGAANDFLLSCEAGHQQPNLHQSLLLLIDGLENVSQLDSTGQESLARLLDNGPERLLWPIATMDPKDSDVGRGWLKNFRTPVFGRVAKPTALTQNAEANLSEFTSGQFVLRERGVGWCRFSAPSLT